MNFKYIAILLVLSSCSAIDKSNIAPGYFQAYESLKNYYFGYENNDITPELVQNIPYASATLKIGKGPLGLLILESKKGDRNLWVSADGVYIETVNGRIVKTQGLLNNLTETIIPESDLRFLKDLEQYNFYLSYDYPKLLDLKISAKIVKSDRRERIQLLNNDLYLTPYEESIKNSYLGWKAVNIYWTDDSGYVWKTVQEISPKLPRFYFEITKKPSE